MIDDKMLLLVLLKEGQRRSQFLIQASLNPIAMEKFAEVKFLPKNLFHGFFSDRKMQIRAH